MSVFMLCEQAVGLVRGKRLILTSSELSLLEALNYEGLAANHAQDEAVVCALHFARVRDRLLQLYPWTFARKTTTVATGGTLPSDCMTVLCVTVWDKPVDWEISGGKLNNTASAEVHYTAKITDTTTWSAAFSDVFVYSLAVEICSAVTGKPEYVQVLEQKAQELIIRAHQIGAIKAETRLTLKQELYRRAVLLSRGQRTIKETSATATTQGTDNAGFVNDRMTAEYQACENAAESVRNRLLEAYPWTFARKSATITETVTAIGGWGHGYKLPADCVKVLAVIGGKEAVEYEQIGTNVYTNDVADTVRYTGLVTGPEGWCGSFRDLFTYQLAVEVVYATSGKADIIQLLEQKSLQVVQFSYSNGVIQPETKLAPSEEVYSRAIAIAHGSEDSEENLTARNSREMSVCRRSYVYVRDRLLQAHKWKFARKKVTLKNGDNMPSDFLAVAGVFVDGKPADMSEIPSGAEYELQYTARVTDMAQWDAIFKDAFCYALAGEIIRAVKGNAELAQSTENRADEYIKQGYRIGSIETETRLSLKDELFMRAITLSRGQRIIAPNSANTVEGGIDYAGNPNWRAEAEYQACVRASDSVRDRLFELYPWTFARKSAVLTESASIVEGWKYGYKLPSDCKKVLAVILGDEALEYEQVGANVYCNKEAGTVRYTGIIIDPENWAGTFRDLFTYQLAIEVVYATTGNAETIQLLEQKSLQIVQFGYNSGVIQAETKLAPSEEIYGRAIAIAHGAETSEENLTARNGREMTVCRRSSAYIRDRLLQAHKWKFARKKVSIRNGIPMPDDFLALAGAFVDGNPKEINEIPGGAIYELHYTARITDINEWDAIFKDAFCYALAGEIIRSVKGDAELAQSTETKATEYIRQGYASGAIETETRLPLRDELFMRAITLSRGQRIIAPNSENSAAGGIDYTGVGNWRSEAEYQACSRASENIRDRLLELYPWVFARKSVDVESNGDTITGWEYAYDLTEDCLTVLTILSKSCNPEPLDYETAGRKVYCNSPSITVRYTARVEDYEQWPSAFTDSYVYLLACEVITATMTAGEAMQGLIVQLTQECEKAISRAYQIGLIRTETNILLKDELCGRAVGLLGGLAVQGEGMLPEMKAQAYSAVRRCYDDIRDGLLETYAWTFARKTTTPALKANRVRGWRYTFQLPPDCLKVNSVLSRDMRFTDTECMRVSDFPENVELTEYEISGSELYTNRELVHVRYTARVTCQDAMPSTFREALIYRLAEEAAMNVAVKPEVHKILMEKEQQAIEEARAFGSIREESRLPRQHESHRAGFLNRQYMDYSGLPTEPCGYGSCYGRRPMHEYGTGELHGWRN